ncbi:hypothetical protein GS854_01645 [Rhodococcus hoagii]|nr:hypothetical protein [Prescottella equi]
MSDNTRELRDVIAGILSANWNYMHTNEALGRQRMLADAVIACLPNHGYTITDLHPETALPDPKGGCVCTGHTQDAGGGYTEHLLEYEPACPEHSQHLYDPRIGEWIHRPDAEGGPHIEAGPVSFGDDGFEVMA